MRPSISLTLEPGLERGVPWGRDLYTFVTSAAGHMMRTLQKPRKNRPSKRQVNHRRFLHNMIQRKFADIEAGKHRLASSLDYRDQDHSSSRSEAADTTSGVHLPNNTRTEDVQNFHDSHHTEAGGKKQTDGGHLWKRQPKSQKRPKESEKECLSEGTSQHHDQTLFKHMHDVQNTDVASFSSPNLSPLSCEFAIQMFHDPPSQRSSTDTSWSDILDLFSLDSPELEPDTEAYFESITADDDAFTDQLAHLTQGLYSSRPEVEDEHGVKNQLWCEDGCHGNEGWLSSEDMVEAQRWTDNQLHASFHSFDYENERHSCMMQNPEHIWSLTPFQGVAESFPASVQAHEARPLPSLPGEDWLFTDVLKSCIC